MEECIYIIDFFCKKYEDISTIISSNRDLAMISYKEKNIDKWIFDNINYEFKTKNLNERYIIMRITHFLIEWIIIR